MFDGCGEVKAHLSGMDWLGVYTETEAPGPATSCCKAGDELKNRRQKLAQEAGVEPR